MTATQFPVTSFDEAIPWLRAPYSANVIRPLIVSVPDDTKIPCVVAFYTTSETPMDRLTIVCGTQWGEDFEVIDKREETEGEKTLYYVKVRATVTVFGQSHSDIGESTSRSWAMAEFEARAQSFKRATRKFGVGQFLWVAEQVKMWRGEENHQLRTDRNKRPFIDERSETHVRGEYEKQLQRVGVPMYGEPLDHMQALGVVVRAALTQTVNSSQNSNPARRASSSATTAVPQSTQAAAEKAGYSDALAAQLIELAGAENHTGRPTAAQTRAADRWLQALTRLALPEADVTRAIEFVIKECSSHVNAQVKLTQWIAKHTQAAAGKDAKHPGDSDLSTSTGQAVQASEDGNRRDAGAKPAGTPVAAQPASNGKPHAAGAKGAPADSQTPNGTKPQDADANLVETLDELDTIRRLFMYPGEVVMKLAALAIGGGPEMQVTWTAIPVKTVARLTHLLECAGTLEWTAGKFNEEVTRAHHNQQETAAGRFAAFDSQLTIASQTHLAESARRSS